MIKDKFEEGNQRKRKVSDSNEFDSMKNYCGSTKGRNWLNDKEIDEAIESQEHDEIAIEDIPEHLIQGDEIIEEMAEEVG